MQNRMKPRTGGALIALAAGFVVAPAQAGPDLITADITTISHYGEQDGIHAYSFGVTSCNLGDVVVDWLIDSPAHPATAQHMYRVKNGRLEQIGLSFAAHTVVPLQGALCETCTPADFQHLGVGCSNPNASTILGSHTILGPREQINAATGAFPFPYTTSAGTGTIDRRLQIPESKLTHDGDEVYYAEVQQVAADDAQAGDSANNASARRVNLLVNDTFTVADATQAGTSALLAWAQTDPDVVIESFDIPDDGRIEVAGKATDLGDGHWRYDYYVHNLDSHLSIGGVYVQVGSSSVSDVSFSAPQYHSGSPVDNQAWSLQPEAGTVWWTVGPYSPDVDQSANAVRWGTTYSFSFVADREPRMVDTYFIPFRPTDLNGVAIPLPAPRPDCLADLAEPFGQLDFSDVVAFLTAFGTMSPEADLAEPFGQWDFSDVVSFLVSFSGGCP
ncbi:MAG: GC-type dockerin domain-anchored protein [Phycisphaerales bacterium]